MLWELLVLTADGLLWHSKSPFQLGYEFPEVYWLWQTSRGPCQGLFAARSDDERQRLVVVSTCPLSSRIHWTHVFEQCFLLHACWLYRFGIWNRRYVLRHCQEYFCYMIFVLRLQVLWYKSFWNDGTRENTTIVATSTISFTKTCLFENVEMISDNSKRHFQLFGEHCHCDASRLFAKCRQACAFLPRVMFTSKPENCFGVRTMIIWLYQHFVLTSISFERNGLTEVMSTTYVRQQSTTIVLVWLGRKEPPYSPWTNKVRSVQLYRRDRLFRRNIKTF